MTKENELVINDACKWEIYKKLVIYMLLSVNYKGNPYRTASSLDMSFEDIKSKHYSDWLPQIMEDLKEYASDCPELFPEQAK